MECFCRCATATSLTCRVSASSIGCSGTELTIQPRRNPHSPSGAQTTTSTTPNGSKVIRPAAWDTAAFDRLLGSADQRQTALASVLAFFRANVGANTNPEFAKIFNPQFALPASLANVTRVDRGYTDSPNSSVTEVFEDFDQPTGFHTSGAANDASGITITHAGIANHSSVQRVARISWGNPGAGTFFQAAGPRPARPQRHGIRDARLPSFRAVQGPAVQYHRLGIHFETNFSIRLVGVTASQTPCNFVLALTGPWGPGTGHRLVAAPNPIDSSHSADSVW